MSGTKTASYESSTSDYRKGRGESETHKKQINAGEAHDEGKSITQKKKPIQRQPPQRLLPSHF